MLQHLRVIVIAFILLHDDATPHQVLVQFNADIPATLEADFGISLLDRLDKRSVSDYIPLAECQPESLDVLRIGNGLTEALAFLRKRVFSHQFGQGVVIDSESERFKLLFTDVHGLYFTDIAVKLAFGDLQDGFCLVVQFRTNMSSCIVVTFVQVQYRVDMEVVHTRPAHEIVYQIDGFTGAVDVIQEVTDAVNDDKTDTRIGSQRMVDNLSALLGAIFP